MIELNTVTLAKGASTDSFIVPRFGKLGVTFRGDLDNETLTLEWSADNATWKAFYAAGVAQTYTSATDIVNVVNYELPGRRYYRYTMSNGAGTPAAIFVEVDGNVQRPV
jgi:hypothetical protein